MKFVIDELGDPYPFENLSFEPFHNKFKPILFGGNLNEEKLFRGLSLRICNPRWRPKKQLFCLVIVKIILIILNKGLIEVHNIMWDTCAEFI